MKVHLKKALAFFLTLAMCLSLLPSGAWAVEDGSILVAGWTWTAHPFGEYGTTATSAPATEQQQGVNAIFTYSNILNSTSTTFKDASIATNNWQSGSEYWQIALDTTGYTELALTFSAYGSNTGPKEFQVQIG
ncbi:hypothetical protein GA029_27010, partial [Bacteroides thetaiotaomicron]